jgi:hypothetical protein
MRLDAVRCHLSKSWIMRRSHPRVAKPGPSDHYHPFDAPRGLIVDVAAASATESFIVE